MCYMSCFLNDWQPGQQYSFLFTHSPVYCEPTALTVSKPFALSCCECEHCSVACAVTSGNASDLACNCWKTALEQDVFCRQPDGKLNSPSRCQGQLKVLHESTFSAGQCKLVLHAELHSISSITKDVPVTVVIRRKDKAAKARVTTCYMEGCDTADDLGCALLTGPEEDRLASEAEKSEMLKV